MKLKCSNCKRWMESNSSSLRLNLLARSGIMVDGMSIGGDVNFLLASPQSCGEGIEPKAVRMKQDFSGAELVCIGAPVKSRNKVGTKNHTVYAIYGKDKMVTIPKCDERDIAKWLEKSDNAKKTVLCFEKPYILSGV